MTLLLPIRNTSTRTSTSIIPVVQCFYCWWVWFGRNNVIFHSCTILISSDIVGNVFSGLLLQFYAYVAHKYLWTLAWLFPTFVISLPSQPKLSEVSESKVWLGFFSRLAETCLANVTWQKANIYFLSFTNSFFSSHLLSQTKICKTSMACLWGKI